MSSFQKSLFIYLAIFFISVQSDDNLLPYANQQTAIDVNNLKKISHCTHDINGTEKHQIFNPQQNSTLTLSLKSFINYDNKFASGHVVYVPFFQYQLSVVEPGGKSGGCSQRIKSTVKNTADNFGGCEIAMNAALFHKSIPCLGNLVINGKRIRDSQGVQNAHFGIFKNNSLFIGYLSEEEFLQDNFQTLVGGVIWLVNNGKSFVNQSLSFECSETEETGSLSRFVNVKSARTAVGHDANGNIVLIHVNGKTDRSGVNLWELADMLIHMGVINAVNFDGGGSASFLINGTVANSPSDECKHDPQFSCSRKVGTIFCVRKSNRNGNSKNRSHFQTPRNNFLQITYLTIIFVLVLISVACLMMVVKFYNSRKKCSKNDNSDVHYSLLNQLGNREILLASGAPSEMGSDTDLSLLNNK